MDEAEQLFFLCIALWVYLSHKFKEDSRRRLATARENTHKKYRRVWETLQRYSAEDAIAQTVKRRRLKMATFGSREARQAPLVWSFNRASQWWDEVVPKFSAEQWVQNFRLSEETFCFLCHKLQPFMERQNTAFRLCVPLKKRVSIALWKLATGGDYRTIGHLFGVSRATVCRCVQEFCAAAESSLVLEFVRCPDQERLQTIAEYFENRWGLPNCVGAVDGSHIPIVAPKEFHTDYFNRKGWHSIVLQAVVDGKGLFWNVNSGQPGSLHDARVLRLSALWELATQGHLFPANPRAFGGITAGYYILGDSAYPLQNWLLKPYSDTGQLTTDQINCNKRLSRARVVVENAFGRLKGRWRCLLKRNDCDVELVKSMAVACCALHNLCETHGEQYQVEWDAPGPVEATQPAGVMAQDTEEGGKEVRDGLMQHLLHN
ncbi:unnamed protein product [Knipowitschia caucasica]